MRKGGIIMQKTFLLCVCVMFLIAPIFANVPLSPRDLALGGGNIAGVSAVLEPISLLNPAGLVSNKSGTMIYYDNGFDISGLAMQGMALNWVGTKAAVGITYNSEGATLPEVRQGELIENFFGERSLGFGLGCKVKGGLSVGLTLWQDTQTAEIQEDVPENLALSRKILGTDLGFLWQNKKLGIGGILRGLSFNNREGQLEYGVGLRLGDVDSLAFFINATVEEGLPLKLHGGVEAWLLPDVALRLGRDRADAFSAGIGVYKGRWQFDYGYKIHPAGNTHNLSTGYTF